MKKSPPYHSNIVTIFTRIDRENHIHFPLLNLKYSHRRWRFYTAVFINLKLIGGSGEALQVGFFT